MRPSIPSLLAVGFAVAGVGLAAGCSSDRGALQGTTLHASTTTSDASTAETACRAIDSDRYYNSAAGTVGETRRLMIGAGSTPLAGVFADQPDNAFIAWCWFHNGNGYWSVVADGRGNKADTKVYTNDPPEPGRPAVG